MNNPLEPKTWDKAAHAAFSINAHHQIIDISANTCSETRETIGIYTQEQARGQVYEAVAAAYRLETIPVTDYISGSLWLSR
jgi:hypothetical protein